MGGCAMGLPAGVHLSQLRGSVENASTVHRNVNKSSPFALSEWVCFFLKLEPAAATEPLLSYLSFLEGRCCGVVLCSSLDPSRTCLFATQRQDQGKACSSGLNSAGISYLRTQKNHRRCLENGPPDDSPFLPLLFRFLSAPAPSPPTRG